MKDIFDLNSELMTQPVSTHKACKRDRHECQSEKAMLDESYPILPHTLTIEY